MAGIQDLLQLAQGGGGAPAPGGTPPPYDAAAGFRRGATNMSVQPGGPPPPGGAPGGGVGAAISQVLGNLMQNPAAMQAMQQYMMQLGGGAPMMSGPGNAQAGPPPGPQDMIPRGTPPGMTPPPGAPTDMQPGNEQDMVSKEIDRQGATWDGTDAPTQNDIERLQSDPSPINIKSFDDQFGEGAAEKYVDQGEGDQSQSDSQDTSGDKNPPDSGEY